MLADLAENYKSFPQFELKIISSRLDKPDFSSIDEETKKDLIDKFIVDASTIVGCPLPTTELFADSLSVQIIRYLTDFGFGNLTLDELNLALLLNLNGDIGIDNSVVEFTGKFINVAFLAKVLKRYMIARKIVDGKIINNLD